MVRCRPGIVPIRGGPGSAVHRYARASRCTASGTPAPSSHLQRRDIDPAPLLPALEPGLRQLHALGAFHQRPLERCAVVEMTDEHLPFDLEAIVVVGAVRDLAPGLEEPD